MVKGRDIFVVGFSLRDSISFQLAELTTYV